MHPDAMELYNEHEKSILIVNSAKTQILLGKERIW